MRNRLQASHSQIKYGVYVANRIYAEFHKILIFLEIHKYDDL